jgi:hypothetical protein
MVTEIGRLESLFLWNAMQAKEMQANYMQDMLYTKNLETKP